MSKKPFTLSNDVFKQIRDDIVEGVIQQGQKIVEVNLAKQYNISRGPLREALHQLEYINLVIRTPHSGSRVTILDYTKIRELYEMREATESFATRLAAINMTRADIDEMYRLIDHHKDYIKTSGDHLFIQQEGNEDFHRFIYSRCGNEWLSNHIEVRLYYLIRMCKKYILKTPARAEIAIVEHTAIANAISNRDPDFAEMLMRRHIQGTWKALKIISAEESLKKYENI